MGKGFPKPAGKYDTGHDHERTPKTNSAPSTGFDNGSRGQKGPTAPGPGIGKNPRGIK